MAESRTPANSNEYDRGRIIKVGARGKLLELYSGLTLALDLDYAQIQGCGGAGHAYRSGIYITIQENDPESNKVKGRSRALVPTWVFSVAKEISLKGITATGNTGLEAAVTTLLGGIRSAERERMKDESQKSAALAMGTAAKAAMEQLTAGVNWHYEQVRVHAHSVRDDGLAPCAVLSIDRADTIPDASGKMTKARLPWALRIKSFYATPKTSATGTITYVSASVKDSQEFLFRMSDNDMYSCCYAVEHFVAQWERAHLEDFQRGLFLHEEKRASRK